MEGDTTIMGKYFDIEESNTFPNSFLLTPNFSTIGIHHIEGSAAIICARLMNLSYANYLRMCRDLLKAEIIGKGHKYPAIYFKDKTLLLKFVKMLDKRMEIVKVNERIEQKKKLIENEDKSYAE